MDNLIMPYPLDSNLPQDIDTSTNANVDFMEQKESYESMFAPSSDGFDSEPEQQSNIKMDTLESARTKKLKSYENLNQNASLDNSFTDMGNGWVESNQNKIWNELEGVEVQNLLEHVIDKYALTRQDNGLLLDTEGHVYLGNSRRLYSFGTKDQDSDVIKMGLARGNTSSSVSRYVEFPSGELGVDMNRLNRDTLLPNDVAVMMEAVLHGRKGAIENRVIKDRYADPLKTAQYGGGSSEYYTNREGLLGVEQERVEGMGERLFKEYMAKLPDKYSGRQPQGPRSIANAVANSFQGFGATFVNELIVKPVDAIGDLTGWFDLDTDGSTIDSVERAFGYDKRAAESAMHTIGGFWDVASDDTKDMSERVGAAANGLLEAFLTPELLGTSLGALLSWVTPGSVIKAARLVKHTAIVNKIDSLQKAGKVTAEGAKAAKAKAALSNNAIKEHLIKQSGFITSSLGNVNKQYEEFVENNNGRELEGTDKAQWFAGRFAVQLLNQNLDKFVDLKVLKAPGIMKALTPAIKAMSNKEFSKAATAMGKGVAVSAASMTTEAAQEYAQTSMELFNSRFGSVQFNNVENFVDFITDERNTREAGIASLAGAGGALQFEAGGLGVSAISSGFVAATANARKKGSPLTPAAEPTAPITAEAVDTAPVPEDVAKQRAEEDDLVVDNTIGSYAGYMGEGELMNVIFAEKEQAADTPAFKENVKKSISDYSASISEVEQAQAILINRAGTVNEKPEDADSLAQINHTKRTIMSLMMEDGKGLVLNSGYTPEDVIEDFLDTVDIKDGKHQTTVAEDANLVRFAKQNGIPLDRFMSIKGRSLGTDTTYAQSLGEGEISASSHRKNLKTLLSTPNVSKSLLKSASDHMERFLHSQEVRYSTYKSTLDAMQVEIGKYNKMAYNDPLKRAKRIEIMNLGDIEAGENKKFINVKTNGDTGVMTVHESSLALIGSIKDTVDHLSRTSERFQDQISSIVYDSTVDAPQDSANPEETKGIVDDEVVPTTSNEEQQDSEDELVESKAGTETTSTTEENLDGLTGQVQDLIDRIGIEAEEYGTGTEDFYEAVQKIREEGTYSDTAVDRAVETLIEPAEPTVVQEILDSGQSSENISVAEDSKVESEQSTKENTAENTEESFIDNTKKVEEDNAPNESETKKAPKKDKTVQTLSDEEILATWYGAVAHAKDGSLNIDKWVSDNIHNKNTQIDHAINNSVGSGMGKAHAYIKDDGKGVKDFHTVKSMYRIPKGTMYQVLDLEPSNYVSVNSTTPLNTLPIDVIRQAPENSDSTNATIDAAVPLIEKAIKKPNLQGAGNLKSFQDLADSPALSLIFDKDLNVNSSVAVALNIAKNNFVKNSGYLLSKGNKSKEDIAELLGLDAVSIGKEAENMMSDKGMLYKTAADSIGKDFAGIMGISRNTASDSDSQAYAALIADLGQVALLMGVAEGLFEIDSTLKSKDFAEVVLNKTFDSNDGDSEYNNDSLVLFLNIPKGRNNAFKNAIKYSEGIEEDIPGSNTTRKPPRYKAPNEKQKAKALNTIRNEKLGLTVADQTQEALEILMDTEWNADLDAMRNMLKDEDAIKARLGFIPIDEENDDYIKLTRQQKDVQPAVNRGLDKSFQEMRLITEAHNEKSVSIWYDYFISKNGRFFIDGNTIQPQANKHLDRFTTQPKTHKFTHRVVKHEGKRAEFFVGKFLVSDKVYYALAQAFGASTDKDATPKNIAMAIKIVDSLNTVEKVEQARDYFLQSGDPTKLVEPENAALSVNDYLLLGIDLEHLGHALQGFQYLKDSLQNPTKFDSSLTAEFDAVTSGFALKNLQTPLLEDAEDWRRRTGVIYSDDEILKRSEYADGEVSMNDVLDTGDMNDSYQSLASRITGMTFDTMMLGLKDRRTVRNTPSNKAIWEALYNVLPQPLEGSVSGELRNLFKATFMLFNYAAAISNIRKNVLVPGMIDGVVERMSKVDLAGDAVLSSRDQGIIELMEALVGENGSLETLQNDIRNEKLSDITSNRASSAGLEKILTTMIDASYGQQVQEVLEKDFAPYIAAQNEVNNAFKAMFAVFSTQFDEKMAEARKKGAVTSEHERKIFEDLKDIWPAIKGPLSTMEGELDKGGIGIYDTATSSPWGIRSRRKQPQVKLAPYLQKKLNKDSNRVSAMLKHLEAAIASGSVIPIHYTDGAVMAMTVIHSKSFGVNGVVTVHDAIIPPMLTPQGKDAWAISLKGYNKNTIEVSAGYSFIHEINVQLQKSVTEAQNSNSAQYTKKTVEVRNEEGEYVSVPVIEFVQNTSRDFSYLADEVSEARNVMFESFNERGIKVMHMAGTSDGVQEFPPGSIEFQPVEKVAVPEYTSSTVPENLLVNVHKSAIDLNCNK